MTGSEIKNSISNNRVFFKRSKQIEYWINFTLLSFVLTMILIIGIKSELENKDFPLLLLIILTLSILLLFNHKIKARKFEIWKIKVSEKQFEDACLATSKYLDWYIEKKAKNYLRANKSCGFQWDGIDITIIRTENEILFNSMPGTSIRSNPFTFGLNKKNRNIFRTQLLKALKGENILEIAKIAEKEKEDRFWKESELTLKNLFIKAIGYSLTLFFVVISIFLLHENFSIKALVLSASFLSICSIFVISDIKITIEKRKRKKHST